MSRQSQPGRRDATHATATPKAERPPPDAVRRSLRPPRSPLHLKAGVPVSLDALALRQLVRGRFHRVVRLRRAPHRQQRLAARGTREGPRARRHGSAAHAAGRRHRRRVCERAFGGGSAPHERRRARPGLEHISLIIYPVISPKINSQMVP